MANDEIEETPIIIDSQERGSIGHDPIMPNNMPEQVDEVDHAVEGAMTHQEK